jgi:C4-dicarboxylate-binding protein DctP
MRVTGAASKALRSLAIALLAGFCLGAAPAAPAQTTLRIALPVSIDSPAGLNIREFARQVDARTSGAVRIELQGKGRSHEEHAVMYAVAAGTVEMGAAPLDQLAHQVPLARAFLQPFLFNFDALIQAATTQESEIRGLIESDILSWTRMRVLWWQPYGSSVLFSKGALATNPRAIAKRAIGTADNQSRDLFTICGGSPRLVAPADVFAELQKGRIDAAAIDLMNVRERDLWRVADTITNLRHAPSLLMIVVNGNAWQRLSAEQQEIFTELAQDAQAYMWTRFSTIRAEAYAFAASKGMGIVDPPAEDVAAWRACSAPLLERYLDRAGDDGPKLFAAYGRLRTNACCREPPVEAPFQQR